MRHHQHMKHQHMKLFFNGFKAGMEKFGIMINTMITTLLLLIVYLIGMGITSLAAKVARKRFLLLKGTESESTYWEELNLNKKPIKEYYRQF